jgi:hypothetical protein
MSDGRQESAEEARARRSKAWTRVVRAGDDVDLEYEDDVYWLRLTPEERVIETWRLSEEIWMLGGREWPDE